MCDEVDRSVRSVADRAAGRVTGDDDGAGDVALLVLLCPPLAVRRRLRPSSLDCGSRRVALVRGLALVASSAWLAALRDLECGSRRAVAIGGAVVVLWRVLLDVADLCSLRSLGLLFLGSGATTCSALSLWRRLNASAIRSLIWSSWLTSMFSRSMPSNRPSSRIWRRISSSISRESTSEELIKERRDDWCSICLTAVRFASSFLRRESSWLLRAAASSLRRRLLSKARVDSGCSR
jgi:hypothetical protein